MSRNDSILSVSSLPLWLSSWTTSFNCLRYAEHEQTHHSYDQIATITRVLAHTYTHTTGQTTSAPGRRKGICFSSPLLAASATDGYSGFATNCSGTHTAYLPSAFVWRGLFFHFLSLLFLRLVRCCCCWDRFYCHDPRATASQYEERLDIYRSPSSCSAPV